MGVSKTKIFNRRDVWLSLICTFVLLVLSVSLSKAQSFDYQQHPRMDFAFDSLKLDLGLQPQNLKIDGAAEYKLSANVAGADSMVVYAPGLDVSTVSLDGNAADYDRRNDSLLVLLNDPSKKGQKYTLRIRYSGSPQFGLLKDANGTAWSSQLSGAQRHWIPIFDNPRATLNTKFNISVPSQFKVHATGLKTGIDTVSANVLTYHFATNQPVPASDLSISAGKFKEYSLSGPVKNMNLAVEKALDDSVQAMQLLQTAQRYVSQLQDTLLKDFPSQHLNIMVLEDGEWEPTSWAASTIYLYESRGNMQRQLLRGIVGQWFGVKQRAAQWHDADILALYQSFLQKTVTDSLPEQSSFNGPDLNFATIYDAFSPYAGSRWQKFLSKNPSLNDIIAQISPRDMLSKLPAVIEWHDVASLWYRQSGQPYFDGIELGDIADSTGKVSPAQQPDSVVYKVTYVMDNANSQLKLRFEAEHGSYDEPVSLKAHENDNGSVTTNNISFNGARDSVVLNISPMISTLRLEVVNRPKLHLNEVKPASFLIYELRNSESTEQRVKAARNLGKHADNPDLQLAIQDFLDSETNPKVKAALLRSMAAITNGASGTQQMFLDALQSKSPEVRRAALASLKYYSDDADVKEKIRQIISNSDQYDNFKNSVQVMSKVESDSAFNTFAAGVIARDTTGHRSLFIIRQLAKAGQVDAAVKKVTPFLNDGYAYSIRKQALQILADYDQAPADWLSRAKDLMVDFDPRIRFLTVEALQKHKTDEISNFLKSRLSHEYDARVYRNIKFYLKK